MTRFDRIFCLLLIPLLLGLGGCVAIVPLIEPDSQPLPAAPAFAGTSTIRTPPRAVPKRREPRLNKLLRDLAHPASVVRTHAAFWLGEMGPAAAGAVNPLVARLDDQSNWVRRASAKALGKIGSPAAVPPLIKSLRDRDKYVAHSAANALRRINTRDARAALTSYHGA